MAQENDKTPKTLSISAKCSDLCFSTLIAEDGTVLKENNGYVPSMMPDRGGDYVELEIDLATGKILNWKKPSKETLDTFIKTGK